MKSKDVSEKLFKLSMIPLISMLIFYSIDFLFLSAISFALMIIIIFVAITENSPFLGLFLNFIFLSLGISIFFKEGKDLNNTIGIYIISISILVVALWLLIGVLRRYTKEKDLVWDGINDKDIALIQKAFILLCQKESLDSILSTEELSQNKLQAISHAANQLHNESKINPSFLCLVTHQYVDSDHILRAMHRDNWVRLMVNRSDLAPSPESYVEYLSKIYFNTKNA